MITKKDIERMQEELKDCINREDWERGEVLVKQINAAKEAAQQSVQRTAVCGCARRTWNESEIGLRCQSCGEYIRRR